MSQTTYTNISNLPTLSTTAGKNWVPVENVDGDNKSGAKVDLNSITPGSLDTTSSSSQEASADEPLTGNIKLHKVAKTGSYNDLLDKPAIPSILVQDVEVDGTSVVNSSGVAEINLGGYYTKSQADSKFVPSEGYVATDNNYTTAEKNKLDGIESGAQVNVKPDWNAESGSNAEILHKPDIPTVGTLNTSNTTAQTVNESESLTGTVNLHKVAKTGSYSDLNNKPSIPTVGKLDTTNTSTQSTQSNESLTGSINLHKIAKTGTYEDLLEKPKLNTYNYSFLENTTEPIDGTINLHSIAKTGYIESLNSKEKLDQYAIYALETSTSDNKYHLRLRPLHIGNFGKICNHIGLYIPYCIVDESSVDDSTADDLYEYDTGDYGVTLTLLWNSDASEYTVISLGEHFYTCENHDDWDPDIWTNKDIETIRIILPFDDSTWTTQNGYIKIMPVNLDAGSDWIMPEEVGIVISYNKNFLINPEPAETNGNDDDDDEEEEENNWILKYNTAFEDDDVPLTCVSERSVINTRKRGVIKIFDSFYEIVQEE